MSGSRFDGVFADQLEDHYRGRDVVCQRRDTLRRLSLEAGESVLDVGSGPGFLAAEMAEIVGPSGRVRGVDASATMVERASARNQHATVAFAAGDAAALDEPDGAYDVYVSTQVAEYVPDTAAMCAEAYRVLRPGGGRGLIMATHMDSASWRTADPERMRRVLQAYRPRSAHHDLPHRLAPALWSAGFAEVRASAFPIVNLDWSAGSYSEGTAAFIAAYVRKLGALPAEEVDGWYAEQEELASSGDYFFAVNRFIFEFQRP